MLAALYEQEDLACYALEQFFHSAAIAEESTAWYVYVKLLKKCSNYRALKTLCRDKRESDTKNEFEILFETSIYLLMSAGYEKVATELVKNQQDGHPLPNLVEEALSHLDEEPSSSYKAVVSVLSERMDIKTASQPIQIQPQGYIYTYNSYQKFGFLKGTDGVKYFFHRSAISDDDLFNQIRDLAPGKQIPVTFEVAQGPKGPLAIGVALYRTIDEMFNRATEYADEGDYSKAIAQIKKVLDLNPVNIGVD